MIDISIIILSYNGKELLGRTLDSVRQSLPEGLSVETIVADNGSTDGSIELVKEQYSWARLLENGQNYGFSKGNNCAVHIASGKYILFLNSDTVVYPGCIKYIYDRLESDRDIGIATCRVELSDGQVDPASHRGFPTPWRAFTYFSGLERLAVKANFPFGLKTVLGGYHLIEKDLTTSHEIDSCTGAFLMTSREVGDKIGWWSEEYFMYGEDLDFCYKVKDLGLKVMYFPEYKILHLKHASGLNKNVSEEKPNQEKLEKVRAIKRRTTTAFYDSMITFYEKFYKNTYPAVIRRLVYLLVEIKKWYALSKIS
jgi:GT2 family glycosyltransferase